MKPSLRNLGAALALGMALVATAPALVLGTRETEDNGYGFGVGTQLFSHLYGQVYWGSYSRDIKFGPSNYNNDKDIWSLRFAYNLAGLEIGALAQWIDGKGDPPQAGTQIDFRQYRMKTFVKAIF